LDQEISMTTKHIKARISERPARAEAAAAASRPAGRDRSAMQQRRIGFDLTQADRQLSLQSRSWRERLIRYRLPLLLGGGLLGGMALAILSRRRGWGAWAP
jgi:hypothetical protein